MNLKRNKKISDYFIKYFFKFLKMVVFWGTIFAVPMVTYYFERMYLRIGNKTFHPSSIEYKKFEKDFGNILNKRWETERKK